jgi:hypothetical protein
MAEFLEKDFNTIEEHIILIEEQEFFEKDSNFDFSFKFLISFSICVGFC